MVESVTETTADVDPGDRWSYWKDTAMAAVDGSHLRDRDGFSAERHVTSLSSGLLVDTASEPLAACRSPRNIALDDGDDACLMTLVRGHGVVDMAGQGGKPLPTGDLALFDLARPYAVTVPTSYREMRVYVRRREFAAKVGDIRVLAGLRFPAGDPLVAMFSGYLGDLLRRLPTMTPGEADIGLEGALHLLSGLVAFALRPRPRRPGGTVRQCRARHRRPPHPGHVDRPRPGRGDAGAGRRRLAGDPLQGIRGPRRRRDRHQGGEAGPRWPSPRRPVGTEPIHAAGGGRVRVRRLRHLRARVPTALRGFREGLAQGLTTGTPKSARAPRQRARSGSHVRPVSWRRAGHARGR